MDYDSTIDYLFHRLPAFERSGASDYKPGLHTSLALAHAFGDPHLKLRCIHIAGTNGKGSTAHTIASLLMASGYHVGLYTSPHLVDFRERARIDGQMIPRHEVTAFVDRYLLMKASGEIPASVEPTFFELTTVMALDWMAREGVDYVVLETGLGGRLDTTNIVVPLLSVITSVALDHTDLLGDTLTAIAAEKAGIIKAGMPAVVCDLSMNEAVVDVFRRKASEVGAPLILVSQCSPVASFIDCGPGAPSLVALRDGRKLPYELTGSLQGANVATALTAIDVLTERGEAIVPPDAVARGLATAATSTGLRGRLSVLPTSSPVTGHSSPVTLYDTGHNPDAWRRIVPQLLDWVGGDASRLHLVLGFVADKDVAAIIDLIPAQARCYLSAPTSPRALSVDDLARLCYARGLSCRDFPTVAEAYAAACDEATPDRGDIVFVGGSNYLIGEFLSAISEQQ